MDKEKYVDESWKEQAFHDKEILADPSEQKSGQEKSGMGNAPKEVYDQADGQVPTSEGDADVGHAMEVDFLNYVTSLGFQAMIFMGEVPNPVTNQVEKNLIQAKFLIDTLSMLKEKTAGNLNEQENNLLENSVYELQLRYVQIVQQEGSPGEGNSK